MSLLEERIKRASKKPPPCKIQKPEPMRSPQHEVAPLPVKTEDVQEDEEEMEEKDDIPQIKLE